MILPQKWPQVKCDETLHEIERSIEILEKLGGPNEEEKAQLQAMVLHTVLMGMQ